MAKSTLSREVIGHFESNRHRFYSSKDLSRGLIVAFDRDGKRRNFPLLSLSIVSFQVSQDNFRSADDVTQRAMYLKKWIKAQSPSQGNSIYFKGKDAHSMATMRRLESLAVSAKNIFIIAAFVNRGTGRGRR